MSTYWTVDGYELTLLADRVGECREWLADKLGLELPPDRFVTLPDGKAARVDLEGTYGNLLGGDGSYGYVEDCIAPLFDEFALEGSWMVLYTDENHEVTRVRADAKGAVVERADAADVFGYIDAVRAAGDVATAHKNARIEELEKELEAQKAVSYAFKATTSSVEDMYRSELAGRLFHLAESLAYPGDAWEDWFPGKDVAGRVDAVREVRLLLGTEEGTSALREWYSELDEDEVKALGGDPAWIDALFKRIEAMRAAERELEPKGSWYLREWAMLSSEEACFEHAYDTLDEALAEAVDIIETDDPHSVELQYDEPDTGRCETVFIASRQGGVISEIDIDALPHSKRTALEAFFEEISGFTDRYIAGILQSDAEKALGQWGVEPTARNLTRAENALAQAGTVWVEEQLPALVEQAMADAGFVKSGQAAKPAKQVDVPKAPARAPHTVAHDETVMRAASKEQSLSAPAKERDKDKGKVI